MILGVRAQVGTRGAHQAAQKPGRCQDTCAGAGVASGGGGVWELGAALGFRRLGASAAGLARLCSGSGLVGPRRWRGGPKGGERGRPSCCAGWAKQATCARAGQKGGVASWAEGKRAGRAGWATASSGRGWLGLLAPWAVLAISFSPYYFLPLLFLFPIF